MKKYKFKGGQIVYLLIDSRVKNDYKECIIRKRKIIDTVPHYQTSEIDGYIYNGKRNFSSEIFDIGIRNLPRLDNWLQEDRIIEIEPESDTAICSKNGCKLVDDFLEKSEKEILEEQYDDIQKQLNIKKLGLLFLEELEEKTKVEILTLENNAVTIHNFLCQEKHILDLIII